MVVIIIIIIVILKNMFLLLHTVNVTTFALIFRSKAVTRQAVIMIDALIGHEAKIFPCPAPEVRLDIMIYF